ncbi:MAG: ribonuclease P [Bacteroides sp.]|nr:ribonuclease P [Bacteroides sp.]
MRRNEEPSEIIGEYCTLIEDYKGYNVAEVVGDYGSQLVVKVSSGAEIVVYRDEVILLN